MKRIKMLLALLVLALSLFSTMGCGKKAAVQAPQEEAVVESNDNGGTTTADSRDSVSTTVNDSGGSAALSENGEPVPVETMTEVPAETELGVVIYPGATLDPDNSATINSSNQPTQLNMSIARFLTSDSLAKVMEFYRGKLGEPMASTPTSADWWQGDMSSGNFTVVQVEQDATRVNINIVHSTATAK